MHAANSSEYRKKGSKIISKYVFIMQRKYVKLIQMFVGMRIKKMGRIYNMDYGTEIYRGFFRKLVKDIAKEITEKYPETSKETSEKTLQLEMVYIRGRLENEGLDHLFKNIPTKETFYQLCYNKSEGKDEYKRRQEYFDAVDFSPILKEYKGNGDIIWILQRTGAKYRKGEGIQVNDRDSYRQFEQLLGQLNFTDREQELFYDSERAFCFNALSDNGDGIYFQQQGMWLSHNGIYAGNGGRNQCLFLNAMEKSNLQIMHEKLRELLDICYKTKTSESIQEMDLEAAIKVAENLSDLVPVIDKNSILKKKKQLQEDKKAVYFAVFSFFMKGKYHNGEPQNESLKRIFEKYFENQLFLKWLFGKYMIKKTLMMNRFWL